MKGALVPRETAREGCQQSPEPVSCSRAGLSACGCTECPAYSLATHIWRCTVGSMQGQDHGVFSEEGGVV